MQRFFIIALFLLLCTGCQNVATTAPTPQPQPYEVQARLVGGADMVITVINNSGAPLELGGWTMQITPAISPTLVAAMPFPEQFSVPNGKLFRAHTAGGPNGPDVVFFDNGGTVPPEAWQKGVKVEMRDPKSDKAITRYIYTIQASAN